MASLADLKPSISTLSREAALQLILQLRSDRREAAKNPQPYKRTPKQSGTEKLEKLIGKMQPHELTMLVQTLKERRKQR